MTKLKHYDNLGTARFITFSCYHGHRLLMDEEAIRIFLDELDLARQRYKFALLGYVIMPNHVHLVIYPQEKIEAGRVFGEIKSRSARRIVSAWKTINNKTLDRIRVFYKGRYRNIFWQRRCYDHNCRTPETVRENIDYCHMNPVKAGLVADPGDWKWSSYAWYRGGKNVELGIDEIEV
jgi:putative transposase